MYRGPPGCAFTECPHDEEPRNMAPSWIQPNLRQAWRVETLLPDLDIKTLEGTSAATRLLLLGRVFDGGVKKRRPQYLFVWRVDFFERWGIPKNGRVGRFSMRELEPHGTRSGPL